MKKILIYIIVLAGISYSCVDMDVKPKQSKTTQTFFNNELELRVATNDLYRDFLFNMDNEEWTDNYWHRQGNGTTDITNAKLNSQTGFVYTYWFNTYKGITRANKILSSMVNADVTPETFDQINAEVRCLRAFFYSLLITHFGDVPFFEEPISLDQAFDIKRTDSKEIKEFIYKELDYAASILPPKHSDVELKTVTSTVALGIKARTALYLGDFAIAKAASKKVMDLGVHKLYEDYGELFHKAHNNESEVIFSIPRSVQYQVVQGSDFCKQRLLRFHGGWTSTTPSWSMIDIYECTDGLTIDKSPLYDPHNPFKNRDPRMTYSTAEHGKEFLGIVYQPHPDSVNIYDFTTAKTVLNKDRRGPVDQKATPWASFTGFVIKKGVEMSWVDNAYKSENDIIILRYADILLMYAEASIELGEIDQSVLDAINMVRARAYIVDKSQVDKYPAITTMDQGKLRSIIRRERRVEFFDEGLRYMDLIRWRLAEKALNMRMPVLNDWAKIDRSQWPFNDKILPTIDENGIVDHSAIIDKGYATQNVVYQFDKNRQYLWPIPAHELLLNSNLEQNPGY